MAEFSTWKPFNPLLGETYELVNDQLELLSEQVSHHPPISANYCRSKIENFSIMSSELRTSSFTGTCLDFKSVYMEYVDLDEFGERYEIKLPTVSAHNLILGTPYIDLGGGSTVKILPKDGSSEIYKCSLKYTKRGWFSKEEFKVEGQVKLYEDENDKVGIPLYQIHGNWNK